MNEKDIRQKIYLKISDNDCIIPKTNLEIERTQLQRLSLCMKKFKIILFFIVNLVFSSYSFADTVLVIHQSYAEVHNNVKGRLEAAGHTVTLAASIPGTINTYDQVWDVRYSTTLSAADINLYDDFVKNGGFLYLTTENPGCCSPRNTNVANLITQMGGGVTTIGGGDSYASNTGIVNTTYMTAGITVTFAAIAEIVNAKGTWLIRDASNKVQGMMWVGNASDLGAGYTGTVLTVADVNWLDSSRFDANNQTALDDIIAGVVAGTVAGTIDDSGNNGGGGNSNDDPTKKADVIGTIESMSNASINFARASFRSIRNRLDWLERNNSDNTSNQGIKVTFKNPVLNTILNKKEENLFDTKQLVSHIPVKDNFSKAVYNPLTDHLLTELNKKVNNYVKDNSNLQLASLNPIGKTLIHDWSLWSAGQIFVGKIDATSTSSGQNSDGLNLAFGMDRPMKNREGLIGFALNVGQDEIKIGSAGSDVNSDNISLSYYNVVPTNHQFEFETQVGLGYINVDSLRIDGSQRLKGKRDIWMPFGSVTVRNKIYEFKNGTFTPYGRGEVAFIQLDPYSEQGGNLALSYNKQTIDRYMLFLGSDINFNKEYKNGKLKPFAAIEYGLDLTSNSDVKMNYVGSSTVYQTELEKLASSNVMMKLGFDYEGKDQTNLAFSYERNEAIGAGHSNSIQVKFSKPLGNVN